MAEYIEREAVKAKKVYDPCRHEKVVPVAEIDWIPAADVVPVVRCKDCKHHYWEQEPCHGRTEHFCKVLESQVDRDFFCACGVRKEK